jgi:4-hydroxy-tetrahydrodipicolinate synthase
MDREEARKRLRGPFVPMITPFKQNLDLDLEGFRKNTRFLLRSGIGTGKGVLMGAVAGGEFPTMTMEERKTAMQVLAEEARGKAPLVTAAQHTDPRMTIELCRHAEDLGIDAVQIAPTYYDMGQTDDDVLRFYRMVAEKTDIGFMVYNTFWHGYNLTVRAMPELLKIKNVVCLKWGAPNEWQYREMMRRYADEIAIMDNMSVHVWNHMHGGAGFLSHPGNFWPEHELLVWNMLEQKKYLEANRELLSINYPFYDLIGEVNASTGMVDANVTKAANELVGLPAGPVRPPARDLTESEKKKLRSLLVKARVPFNRSV